MVHFSMSKHQAGKVLYGLPNQVNAYRGLRNARLSLSVPRITGQRQIRGPGR